MAAIAITPQRGGEPNSNPVCLNRAYPSPVVHATYGWPEKQLAHSLCLVPALVAPCMCTLRALPQYACMGACTAPVMIDIVYGRRYMCINTSDMLEWAEAVIARLGIGVWPMPQHSKLGRYSTTQYWGPGGPRVPWRG